MSEEHGEVAADQLAPDSIIDVDRRLSEEEFDTLREHVKLHGLTDLPFGAKARKPTDAGNDPDVRS